MQASRNNISYDEDIHEAVCLVQGAAGLPDRYIDYLCETLTDLRRSDSFCSTHIKTLSCYGMPVINLLQREAPIIWLLTGEQAAYLLIKSIKHCYGTGMEKVDKNF